MKLKFTIYDLRFTISKKSSATARGHQLSTFNPQPSERGIALVITLILLAVTLVMALAFLAISRRESGSVASAADIAAARNAADSGLATAEAQVMANIFSTINTTNPACYNFGLLVSTNTTLNPLTNLANLSINPRAPVFIPQNGSNDFRFYLDLNRNGRFDSNGVVAEVNSAGVTNGNFISEVGDPEWIGVLARPDAPYGPNNPFIARIAFIAVPAGNDLDFNAIHNQTITRQVDASPANFASDGFFRNEGVGSWELNLASFLTDLDTNVWDPGTDFYNYREPNFPNQGRGFEDALSLLSYRYAYNYNSLAGGYAALFNNSIDGYTIGELMTNTFLSAVNIPINGTNTPWAGSDNTNHYFTPSDLFDPTKTSVQFTNDLISAGISNATYDRYTFYRLLSQIGTDTTPESGKMNLNYDNLDASGNVIPGAETNLIAWTPVRFFTNAADRMLRAYTANWFNASSNSFYTNFLVTSPFGIGNIPVYVNGQFVYTPAVQRVLQLAANIYDSTVNNSTGGSPDYPDVFRPLFSRDGSGNIFVSSYASVVPFTDGTNDVQLLAPVDVTTVSLTNGVVINAPINIYGVPWIIGAKKGFPNFNEFAMENNLAVTRRLQLTRTTNSATPKITSTNQMYTMAYNSSLGVELWNSYASNYPGTIVIGGNQNSSVIITNDDHGSHAWILQSTSTNFSFSINPWPGTAPSYGGTPNTLSFFTATFNGPMLTNSIYRSSFAAPANLPAGFASPNLIQTNLIAAPMVTALFESNSPNGFFLPQFGLLVTNHLQLFMLDFTNGVYHVIDYVHFTGPNSAFNVNGILADNDTVNNYVGVWDTNYPAGNVPPAGTTYPPEVNHGILNQILISKANGTVPAEDGQWQGDPDYPAATSPQQIAQQQNFFQAFFLPGNRYTPSGGAVPVTNLQLSVQAPYSPTRYICQYVTWQANDPLVHYLASDIDEPSLNNITMPPQGLTNSSVSASTFAPLTGLNLGSMNDRYMPWGGNPKYATMDPNPYNTALKDPNVASSDNWDFPNYKLPAIGWLGRVHRGTPWQTVYLKAGNILTNAAAWSTWTGNGNAFDAANAAPISDRLLFDLFTTAFNDNSTRGQLSVNQPGLAALSALLGGVVALTNNPYILPVQTVTNMTIQPAGIYTPTNNPPPLVQIWQDINNARANQVNADGLRGAFEHVGDILGAPTLSDQSPFISTVPGVIDPASGNWSPPPVYPSDEVMEWMPQQVMSLLRVGTPRYVIYSYGQALRPAPNSVVTSGGNFGMVTNYQVVSEVAARAVVRFDSTVTNMNGTLTVTNNHAVIESYNILPPD